MTTMTTTAQSGPGYFSVADETWTVEVRADVGSMALTFVARRRDRRFGLGDQPEPWRGLALLIRDLLEHAAVDSGPGAWDRNAVAAARAILQWRPAAGPVPPA